jgi:hypothetical protein
MQQQHGKSGRAISKNETKISKKNVINVNSATKPKMKIAGMKEINAASIVRPLTPK